MDRLYDFLEEERPFELIEEGIYSVLDTPSHRHPYDKRAALYDFVVGTRIYNRVFWGALPDQHTAFARAADTSQLHGPILDAGCGSLLFTAQAHLDCGRLVVACDQSIDMLRRARARLRQLSHADPGNVILVQADLSSLPFRKKAFHTVLCMNVLHHYPDAADLLRALKTLLCEGGDLYLTSLVQSNRLIGDHYLSLLHKAGWIVRPRSAAELDKVTEDALQQRATIRSEGNMAYLSMLNARARNAGSEVTDLV